MTEPILILFAEDDEDDRIFFKKALADTKLPIEIKTFDNGKKIMDHLSGKLERMPDVIVLDISMPLLSGLQCLAQIRSMDVLREIPVIMFSNVLHESQVKEAFQLGACRYLHKPLTLQAETKMLKKLFGNPDWKEKLIAPDSFLIQDRSIKKEA